MFPRPIQKSPAWWQASYKLLLPIALVIWLLPLIGIAVTSIRPSSDLAAGNYNSSTLSVFLNTSR